MADSMAVVEIHREGFVEVIELDPSSSLVSMRLSAVRKLSSRISRRNGDRLVLVHVATRTRAYDSDLADHTATFL